jgi:hypothetical protein
MSIFKDQADFMAAGKQTVKPGCRPQIKLYENLVGEESGEFLLATNEVERIKECVDTMVTCAGYLISTLGVEGAQKAWNLVHEGNLSKVSGIVEHREDGKVLKSAKYKKLSRLRILAGLEALLIEAGKQ